MTTPVIPHHRRGRTRTAIAVVTVVGALASVLILVSATSPATALATVRFTDAGGTVACRIVPAGEGTAYYDEVRCDLLTAATPVALPPRPPGCHRTWAKSATMIRDDVPAWGACVGATLDSGNDLEPGTQVSGGTIHCTVLDPGVACRDTSSKRGFRLTPATLTYLRPPARRTISPSGIGKVRIGMTVKRAKRTGHLGKPVCGNPQLKPRYGRSIYLTWHKRRLASVLANVHTDSQSTRGVGVGSMLRDVRGRYRTSEIVRTKDLVAGARAYVVRVRDKRGSLILLLETQHPKQRPSASTPVKALWVTRSFRPRLGYAFDGC
ncbi:hypothetical protein [Nocardioides sambongensis]|uniref:hypothetical protein n=1 Tax=Nocardioides sambongensis TaxID=2589074 RepID=UPI00112A9CC3|nr:hypothetical protein [Nocardioides sambongensis]